MLLELEGYDCQGFEKGEDALESIRKNPDVDLILLDLNTDGIPAPDFAQAVRALYGAPCERRPRLGILSGSNQIERVARQIGADFLVSKPFRIEDVLQHVRAMAGATPWLPLPAVS